RLGALDALPTHAIGIEPFLPIRAFRTKNELRRILNHDLPPLRKQDLLLFRYAAIEFRSSRFDHYVGSPTRAIITDRLYLGRIVACNSVKESIAIACNPLIGWIHSNED